MKIENVNTGICHYRAANNEPCFFVNWMENGQNKYEFFTILSFREQLKNRLLKIQNNI